MGYMTAINDIDTPKATKRLLNNLAIITHAQPSSA
jgi:hypothetical protein